MSEPTAAALRQQYRSKLDAGLAQGRELLGRYQQAYPDLAQIDWAGGQPGPEPHAPLSGETAGTFGDPRRQLAFLAAPGMVRAGRRP